MRTVFCIPLLLVALSGASCSIVEHADYGAISADTGVALSKGAMPDGVTAVGMVVSRQSGFYMFGVLPFHRVSPDRCLRKLAAVAAQLEARGVAEIDVRYETAAFITINTQTIFGFPWWATIQMIGQAWR